MRLHPLLLCLIAHRAFGADLTSDIPPNSREAVLVTTPDWSSSIGTLRRLERGDEHSKWQPVGNPVAVILGKHGLGWGLGLSPIPNDPGPRKAEGDLRSPAGVFSFGEAFGFAPHSAVPWLRMPYHPLKPTTEGVDDPASQFYNRIVDRAQIATPDWHSSEHMAQVPAYALGIVIAANPQCVPKAGSCIYLHLWMPGHTGTVGCTALKPADLADLLRWLDPAKKPLLIQLPEPVARTALLGF
jgi:D-alanyl-D-alanine dipeptidase